MPVLDWTGKNAVVNHHREVRSAFLFIFVSVLTRAGFALGGPEDGTDRHSWKTYTNVRFQYRICYPADLMVPQGEPDNGDGQKFLARDGAELIVYGSNNALDESLKNTLADTGARLAGPSGKVTYKMLKANWFVVSGQNGQTVFYSKVLYNKHDDQFKSFQTAFVQRSNHRGASFHQICGASSQQFERGLIARPQATYGLP